MQCAECGNICSDYNFKYCSIACRNKAVSKVPRGTHKRTNMVCMHCGDIYVVRNSQAKRSKFCSKKCQWETLKKSEE